MNIQNILNSRGWEKKWNFKIGLHTLLPPIEFHPFWLWLGFFEMNFFIDHRQE
jgi:hypothetical protein